METFYDKFLSLFFSISYENEISDIVLDSVFFLFESTVILAVLITLHGDFTGNNIEQMSNKNKSKGASFPHLKKR